MTDNIKRLVLVYAATVATAAMSMQLGRCWPRDERPLVERLAEQMLGPCAKWPREEPCPTDDLVLTPAAGDWRMSPPIEWHSPSAGSYSADGGRVFCAVAGRTICECVPGTVRDSEGK